MKKSAVLLCGLLAGISAEAANITWVSFHSAQDDTPNQTLLDAGFTVAPDAGYTQLLRDAGHTVTRYLTRDIPEANILNASDLVIISRSVNSGHYELDAETAAWNGITAPMILLGGYTLRNSRLGFTTGGTMVDTAGTVKLTINNPAHPIFEGITLDGSNTMVDDFATRVSLNGVQQRGISVNNNPISAGGTVLATLGTAGETAFGGLMIGEWQAGATMSTTPQDTLGGDRLVFLTGSREDASPSDKAGVYDLTPTGAAMFLNAVDYMAIPEPSTYALFGLGAMALLMRRKKA